MTESLAHRGPDGAGVATYGAAGPGRTAEGAIVALGHRRLAILDPSDRARQPMTREGVSVSFNGEIYNYVELRAELRGLGHAFTTSSDTEVLLEAYRQWGVDCLERFNGIFAFALWDAHRRSLIVARDRMGVKPVYWVVDGGRLMVASEMRALKVALGRPAINEALVYDFLLSGRLDHSSESFLQGIQRLPAGCRLEVRDGSQSLTRYWQLEPTDARYGRTFAQNAAEFGALFCDAVRLQMRADVPVGCCLSGGLDSASVAVVASQLTARPMSVFTARYRHAQADEWRYATSVHAGRNLIPIAVFAEAKEFWTQLDHVIQAQEAPFGNPSVFAQWRLMKEIKAHGVKVVLDGQGGDELLCGYAKYFYFHLADLMRAGRPLEAAAALLSAAVTGGPQLLNLAGAKRYLPGAWWLERRKRTLLQPEFQGRWQGRYEAHPHGSVIDQQVLDLTKLGLPTLLRYEDKNSMAHGVESRVPFLDHRLVEFALSVPVEHKIRGARAKLLLREALRGTLPEPIRCRRSKLGFGGAWHVWVTELGAELSEWLDRPHLAVDRYVQRSALRDMLLRRDAAIFPSLILDRWLQLEEGSTH